MIPNLAAFAGAALLEIAGCFAFWKWLRDDQAPWIAACGVLCLIGFAALLTRVDAPFAGRTYAAYGAIYIVASLLWLWLVEGQRPSIPDAIGAALALCGAIVIVSFAAKR